MQNHIDLNSGKAYQPRAVESLVDNFLFAMFNDVTVPVVTIDRYSFNTCNPPIVDMSSSAIEKMGTDIRVRKS